MGKVSFQAWARYQAMGAAWVLLFDGIIAVSHRAIVSPASQDFTTGIGAYAMILGLLILYYERPLWGIEHLGPFTTNFYVRTLIYVLASAPLFSLGPTISGGFFLFCTACFYFTAAYKQEVWVNQIPKKGGGGGGEGEARKPAPPKEEKKVEEKKEEPKKGPSPPPQVNSLPPANNKNQPQSTQNTNSEAYYDESSGQYYDPNTGQYYDPNTGYYYDPNTGHYYDPNTQQYYDPNTQQYYTQQSNPY